jgi:hypothetical protein
MLCIRLDIHPPLRSSGCNLQLANAQYHAAPALLSRYEPQDENSHNESVPFGLGFSHLAYR